MSHVFKLIDEDCEIIIKGKTTYQEQKLTAEMYAEKYALHYRAIYEDLISDRIWAYQEISDATWENVRLMHVSRGVLREKREEIEKMVSMARKTNPTRECIEKFLTDKTLFKLN